MPSGAGSAPLWLALHLWAGLRTEHAGTGAGWKGQDCFLGTRLSLRSLSWPKPACSVRSSPSALPPGLRVGRIQGTPQQSCSL